MSTENTAIKTLFEQSKYIEAQVLYNKLSQQAKDDIKNIVDVGMMLHRAAETIRSIDSVNDISHTEWILGMQYFGVTTYYKIDSNNHLHVKLDGILDDIPLFEQAAVFYEIDQFIHWIPFLHNSLLIDKVSTTDLIAYISAFIPPVGRDCLVRVYASDCLKDHDKMVLIGSALEDWPVKAHFHTSTTDILNTNTTSTTNATNNSKTNCINYEKDLEPNNINNGNIHEEQSHMKSSSIAPSSSSSSSSSSTNHPSSSSSLSTKYPLKIPWIIKGWFNDRMDVIEFRAIFTLLGPKKVETSFIFCVDPRAAIPRSILNIIVRNIAGMFLYVFKKQVLKVGKGDNCIYRERIKANPEFYRYWIYKKLCDYYDMKGWIMDTEHYEQLLS